MNDLQEEKDVKALLQSKAAYFEAPKDLRVQLAQQFKTNPSKNIGMKIWDWLLAPTPQLASGFALGALVASTITGSWLSSQQDQKTMLLALASDHAHAMVTQNTIEIPSSNRHTVKPWLSSQLGYSPLVFDLAEQGYPLVGGRRGFIGGTPVAVAVYSYKQHEIDVYALNPSMYQKFPPHLESVDGFNVTNWKVDGLNYVALSDMNSTQLKSFAALLSEKQEANQE